MKNLIKFRRINIFGGPGVGKSATAEFLSSQLKKKYNVELIREYFKKWVYLTKQPLGFDQIYIFAKQLHEEEVALRHVDFIITDSPIDLSGIIYSNFDLSSIVNLFNEVYPPLNILIKRNDNYYKEVGRIHSLEESKLIDDKIRKYLNNKNYYECEAEEIIHYVESNINSFEQQ